MRTTIVPAQITSVEDRIAANLSLTQLILLIIPIFIGLFVYAFVPPFMQNAFYKMIAAALVLLTFCLLAIRFKGRILMEWTLLLIRYNVRSKYYVFDKNNLVSREEVRQDIEYSDIAEVVTDKKTARPVLGFSDALRAKELLANPAAHVTFKGSKRGGLHVLITEIEQ